MMDGMANHATRIHRHIDREGHEPVEQFLDVCLTLDNLIDPYSLFMKRSAPVLKPTRPTLREQAARGVRFPAKPYMDRYINPPERLREEEERETAEANARKRAFPASPDRDVLGECSPRGGGRQELLLKSLPIALLENGDSWQLGEGWDNSIRLGIGEGEGDLKAGPLSTTNGVE